MKKPDRRVGVVVGGAATAGILAAMLGLGTAGSAQAGAYAYNTSPRLSVSDTSPARGHSFRVRGSHFKARSTVKLHFAFGTGKKAVIVAAPHPTTMAASNGGWSVPESVTKRGHGFVVVDGLNSSGEAIHLRVAIEVG